MNRAQIKSAALACGFKLREQADGSLDLNEYVYAFAALLIRDAQRHNSKQELLDQIEAAATGVQPAPRKVDGPKELRDQIQRILDSKGRLRFSLREKRKALEYANDRLNAAMAAAAMARFIASHHSSETAALAHIDIIMANLLAGCEINGRHPGYVTIKEDQFLALYYTGYWSDELIKTAEAIDQADQAPDQDQHQPANTQFAQHVAARFSEVQ